MSTAHSAPPAGDVAERLRSLQLGTAERKTAEFGLRGVFWLMMLSVIGAGAWWVSQHGIPNQESLQETARQWMPGGKTKFEVVPVRVEGGEEVLLDLTGYITPRDKVNVTPRVPGLLIAVNVNEGQTVEQGQELARLDDTTYRADYEQALAAQTVAESRLAEMRNGVLPEELEQANTAVEQAQKKVTLAEKEHERAKNLRDITTTAEYDQIESTLHDARAHLKTMEHKQKLLKDGPRPERMQAAEAEVAQTGSVVVKAKTALDNTSIVAPISGVVLERRAAVGEQFRPDALGTGMFVIADLTNLEVQVDVEEQSLGKLRVGQPCRIVPDAYSDRSYAARISRWQPQVNRARAVVRVVLSIDAPDDLLLAEMNCRAIILASPDKPQPETLWIPESAVVTEGDQPAVFVAVNGVAEKRPVKVGETKDHQIHITDGLTKNDQVVLPSPNPPTAGQTLK